MVFSLISSYSFSLQMTTLHSCDFFFSFQWLSHSHDAIVYLVHIPPLSFLAPHPFQIPKTIIVPSIFTHYQGVLSEGDWNQAGLCCRVEQSWVCFQCTWWNLVGHSSLWESCDVGSKLFGCLHQPWKCSQGSQDFWQVKPRNYSLRVHWNVHNYGLVWNYLHHITFSFAELLLRTSAHSTWARTMRWFTEIWHAYIMSKGKRSFKRYML